MITEATRTIDSRIRTRFSFTLRGLLSYATLCVLPFALIRLAVEGEEPLKSVAGVCGIFLLGAPLGIPVGYILGGRRGAVSGVLLAGMFAFASFCVFIFIAAGGYTR